LYNRRLLPRRALASRVKWESLSTTRQKRATPLSEAERAGIDDVVARYPLDALIAESGVDEAEYDGEPFYVNLADDDAAPGVVLQGSTRLPFCSLEGMAAASEYWCRLLSDVRRLLPDCDWHVHIDYFDVPWIEERGAFDPTAIGG